MGSGVWVPIASNTFVLSTSTGQLTVTYRFPGVAPFEDLGGTLPGSSLFGGGKFKGTGADCECIAFEIEWVSPSASSPDPAYVGDFQAVLKAHVQGPGGTGAIISSETVTFTQTPVPPTFSIADATVGEGDGTVVLEVALDPTTSTLFTVTYTTADGTATLGDDYTGTGGVLTSGLAGVISFDPSANVQLNADVVDVVWTSEVGEEGYLDMGNLRNRTDDQGGLLRDDL